jgi:glutamyl-tRNA reductase
VDVVSRASDVPSTELRAAITVLTSDEVVTHLFAVTSGLESVVVGEDEISGQVGRALQRARTGGTTSGDLEQLFQRATQTSRGVKTRTSIGGAGRSLVRLALELAGARIPDWALTRVLIVGTGQYAATTAAAVRDRGATMLSVFSPSGRADAFGAKYGVAVQRDLAGALLDADLIITCTSATVIGTSAIIGDQRRLVIDLGMPRNVDPAIVSLPGIELLDLETISLHAPVEELTATASARALVSDAAARYSAERSIEPSIVALRTHIFELLEKEVERANKRGAGPETEQALRHLAGVLLHTPSVLARDAALDGRGQEFVDGLQSVFGVTSELASEEPRSDEATA